ncbi:DUF3558 family protein [Actinopolyspora sp. H202]|uniref:DUF3558 family protein n=1 Tax=Actinopolyspora sp. H202 TaxID=1500456 RepID=UPI003EE5E4CB
MSARLVRFITAILVLFALATACGSSDRPRELSLDDVRPCDLIPRTKLRDLQVKAPPQPVSVVEGSDEEGTSCQYSPKYGGTVTVAVVTNHGIDRWTNGSMASSRAVDLPRVRGYRVIRLEYGESASGPHESCTTYVDVASGQSLKVHVSENSTDDPPTCETARRFTRSAIRSLAG